MREVVGFFQLACALTLGMAGGWALHQMGVMITARMFSVPLRLSQCGTRRRGADHNGESEYAGPGCDSS